MTETYPRRVLVPERIYHAQASGDWFYTPDGVGCIWYNTAAEARADTGSTDPVITIHQPLED